MIDSAARMMVPQNGVMYLGWMRPKIAGSDLWAAIDRVWRVSGNRVVSAEAAPEVKMQRNTRRSQVPPMTSWAIGLNTSPGFLARKSGPWYACIAAVMRTYMTTRMRVFSTAETPGMVRESSLSSLTASTVSQPQ